MRRIILILILFSFLSATPWRHVLSDYSIIDIEKYDGGYWVATESDGAFRYDSSAYKWFRYNKDNGVMLQNDNINDMKIMDGKVWFATNYGIYTCSLTGSNWQHKLLPPGDYFTNWVRAFDENYDTIFICGFTGLFTYSKQTKVFTAHDISLPDNYQTSYTNSVFVTDSIVWIGTDDGVFRYDTSMPIGNDSSLSYYSKSNGIPTTSDLVMCRSLYANEQGLWLGLDEYTSTIAPNYCQGGLFMFNGNTWLKYDESTGLPADGIHFIQEHDNKIYAGLFHYVDGVNFEGAGMLVIDLSDSLWKVLNKNNWHIGNNSVRSFYCTETDTLVGTDHGLFTNVYSIYGLVPFDAPEWFSVRSLGNRELEVNVEPVYLAERYMLYADNLDGVSSTCPIYGTRDTITLLNESSIYSVTICAANQWGHGPFCKDVLTVTTGDEKNPILLIQGFDKEMQGNTYDFSLDHSLPMYENGLGFDATSDEALDLLDLNSYAMIDWYFGCENNIMSTETKQHISSYLESGGKLFISGSQIIESVTGINMDQEFYNNYLMASWKKSGTGAYDVQSISNAAFDGIGMIQFGDAYDVSRPDGFKPINGAGSCLLYAEKDSSSYGSAALQYTGAFGSSENEGQLVYFAFPFESIESDSMKSALMLGVLNYFDFDVTLTSNQEVDIASNVELIQNYPNPFNPITTISYQLSADSNVELNIYDLNGRFITDLINEHQDVGDYEIHFNGSGLSSGVYICRLQAGNVVRSMKMLLLK